MSPVTTTTASPRPTAASATGSSPDRHLDLGFDLGFERVLERGLDLDVAPLRAAEASSDPRSSLLTLAAIHDLGLGPVRPGTALQHLQHHPQVVAVQHRLEQRLLAQVDEEAARLLGAAPTAEDLDDPDAAVAAIRALANDGLVPPVYDWVADEAGPAEVRAFLALEGGPDDSFDDLVAIAQVGLDGLPKLEAATNYWDELGEGDATTARGDRRAYRQR